MGEIKEHTKKKDSLAVKNNRKTQNKKDQSKNTWIHNWCINRLIWETEKLKLLAQHPI